MSYWIIQQSLKFLLISQLFTLQKQNPFASMEFNLIFKVFYYIEWNNEVE